MGDPEKKPWEPPKCCYMCNDDLAKGTVWVGVLNFGCFHYKAKEIVKVCGDCYDAICQLGLALKGSFIEEQWDGFNPELKYELEESR